MPLRRTITELPDEASDDEWNALDEKLRAIEESEPSAQLLQRVLASEK